VPRTAANGIEIDYGVRGPERGPALVLLRGLSTQRTAWPERLLDDLAGRGFRVLTPDNRDAGLSSDFEHAGVADVADAMARVARGEPVPAPYLLDDMAQDVVGLLDALGIASAHVAGISMGGMIAQVLAAQHPGRVRSLCSIMSSSGRPGLPGPTPEAAVALLSEPPSRAREDVVRHNVATQKVLSPGFPQTEAELYRQMAAAYDRSYRPEGGGRQLLAVLASGSRAALLGRIRAPTLVIHGADDPLVPLECGRDTAKHVAGAELLVVPGMGHDLVPGNAPLLAEAIAAHALRADAEARP
jgi:pimeloyl-ACP methyl ester carboxylesterase